MAKKLFTFSPTYWARQPGHEQAYVPATTQGVNTRGEPRLLYTFEIDQLRTSWADSFTITATVESEFNYEEATSSYTLACTIGDATRTAVFTDNVARTVQFDFSGVTADHVTISGNSVVIEFNCLTEAYGGFTISAPYLKLDIPYEASSQIVPNPICPTSGTIDINDDILFSATLQNTTSPPLEVDLSILTAVFYWRSGTSGEFHSSDMTVNGTNASLTVVGGTFSPGTIQWYIEAKDQNNHVSQTDLYAVSSMRKSVESTPVYPINVLIDSSEPVIFQWAYSSMNASPQSRAELQISQDDETWTALGTVVGAETSYEVNNLSGFAGTVYWRVLSVNSNSESSDWSASAPFIVRTAPDVQNVSATAKPWTALTWQSNDQKSYEIFVDGKSLGIFFGAERQYMLPDYLKDGVHTIGLRVLGSFDLWSRISETQVTIQNTPTSTLTLKAPTNIDTALEWTGGSGDFFVYRDGLMIAHTNAHSFTDRTALGEHDYQVVERLASGDYNASAVITRTPDVYCLHIAALSGGEWIAIPHRLKNESDPEYSESVEVVYNHLAGIYEPVASIGQYRDDSGKYSAVFLFNELEEHKRFRALRGKPVILKTADGEVVIGILHAWERKHVLNHYRYAERREIYAAYSFTIQRIGWGDFIDVP